VTGGEPPVTMPKLSVVVPIYNVEDYLDECLRSLAAQTFGDFEAVLVDDGSTDESAAIAERFAAADPRFRVVRQPNGGLSRARNTGTAEARGEYLAFLDSDDVLPLEAYARLIGALERTGSDFASGNMERLTATGLEQAAFVAAAFRRTRLRTHVRRFAPLLADRTACNKVWRRSFWDAQALRFPDGRLHEDIPVVIPAHFRASSVDVISAPVYRYRVRDGGAPSITQLRRELRSLRDRRAAVEEVRAYIAEHESARQRRRYDRNVVAHDLRYHLDLLPDADAEYRDELVDWAGALLSAAGPRVCDDLPAFDRVRYYLIRTGRVEELMALRREPTLRTPPRRRFGRYYADYGVPSLPRALVRLGRRDQELSLTVHLEDLRCEDGRLRLAGHAYLNALGAPAPQSQRVELHAVSGGPRRALRMRLTPRRLPTARVARADLEPRLRWAGFETSVPAGALPDAGARWDVLAYVRSGGLRRRRAVFVVDDPALVKTVDAAYVRASLSANGRLALTVAAR
jgi:CDP-glycerol glycerophosphotransferase